MIWTILLLVLAAAPALYRGWLGWSYGASTEMRHLITYLFAMLLALRFWEPFTGTLQKGLNFDPCFIAIGAYILLFVLGTAVAGFVVKIKADAYRSVSMDYINQGLGLAAGLFSGSLLGGSLALLLSLAIPSRVAEAASPMVEAAVEWPGTLASVIETHIADVPRGSAASIRFPVVKFVEVPLASGAPEATAAQPGTAVMRLHPTLDWK